MFNCKSERLHSVKSWERTGTNDEKCSKNGLYVVLTGRLPGWCCGQNFRSLMQQIAGLTFYRAIPMAAENGILIFAAQHEKNIIE